MNIITNESIILCDVDNTLIEDYTPATVFIAYPDENTVPFYVPTTNKGYLELDYYGKQVYKKPIMEHVDFIRSLKKRGYYIIVHSGNGYLWAKQVVSALDMNDCVDMVMTKACKHLDDDADTTHVIGPRIFLKEQK